MKTRVLAIADLHGREDWMAALIERHPDLQSVFLAGDITGFGDVASMRRIVAAIRSNNKERIIAAVGGNCDPPDVCRYLEDNGFSAESRVLNLGFTSVLGAGGGLFRGGGTCFERDEDALEDALLSAVNMRNAALACADGLSDSASRAGLASAGAQPLVILSHTPPFSTDADLRYGRHVGSRSFAALLHTIKPDLWLCGHIHESRCASKEGDTLVVNPGPAASGQYAILEFESGDFSSAARAPGCAAARVRAALSS